MATKQKTFYTYDELHAKSIADWLYDVDDTVDFVDRVLGIGAESVDDLVRYSNGGSVKFGHHYAFYDDDIEATLEEGMRREDAEMYIGEIEEDAENTASLLNRTFVGTV